MTISSSAWSGAISTGATNGIGCRWPKSGPTAAANTPPLAQLDTCYPPCYPPATQVRSLLRSPLRSASIPPAIPLRSIPPYPPAGSSPALGLGGPRQATPESKKGRAENSSILDKQCLYSTAALCPIISRCLPGFAARVTQRVFGLTGYQRSPNSQAHPRPSYGVGICCVLQVAHLGRPMCFPGFRDAGSNIAQTLAAQANSRSTLAVQASEGVLCAWLATFQELRRQTAARLAEPPAKPEIWRDAWDRTPLRPRWGCRRGGKPSRSPKSSSRPNFASSSEKTLLPFRHTGGLSIFGGGFPKNPWRPADRAAMTQASPHSVFRIAGGGLLPGAGGLTSGVLAGCHDD
jgi:hypothetical protein